MLACAGVVPFMGGGGGALQDKTLSVSVAPPLKIALAPCRQFTLGRGSTRGVMCAVKDSAGDGGMHEAASRGCRLGWSLESPVTEYGAEREREREIDLPHSCFYASSKRVDSDSDGGGVLWWGRTEGRGRREEEGEKLLRGGGNAAHNRCPHLLSTSASSASATRMRGLLRQCW